MNEGHRTQAPSNFRSSHNVTSQNRTPKAEYRQDHKNYTDQEQRTREQAHLRPLTAPTPATIQARREFSISPESFGLVQALLDAAPTLGIVALQIVLCIMKGDKSAIMLALLILSCSQAPLSAASDIPTSSLDNSKRVTEQSACGGTNFLPANKAEGTVFVSTLDTTSNRYHIYDSPPNGISAEQWNNLQKEQRQRSKIFDELDLRKKASGAYRTTVNKMMADCGVTSAAISKSPINRNVVEEIIGSKTTDYQYVKEIYSSKQRPLIGKCFEVNAQASLLVMPELKPDEEFFVRISSKSRESKNTHVYGLIIPRNLLMGEGLPPEERNNFRKLITNPFFKEGKAVIQLKGNEKLFWKSLGISNTNAKVVDEAVAGQTRFCDPYMGKGLYCNGLQNCFEDSRTAQVYLLALETIVDIKILTWEIPRELKPKVSHGVECLNKEINRKISLLVEKRIKPALIDKASIDKEREL